MHNQYYQLLLPRQSHRQSSLIIKLSRNYKAQLFYINLKLGNNVDGKIQMLQGSRLIRGKQRSYRLGELLGSGQFGKVFKGTPLIVEGQPVAVKIIRRNKFTRNQKLKELLERQIEILSGLEHQNIIVFQQLIIQKQDVCIVYEYCEGGTLEDRLPMKEQELLPIAIQITNALISAQKKQIVHRDIKPANILFKNGKVKIADWGFSRLLQNGQTTSSFIGSPAYMAPQILKGSEYSQKADIWSLGVVLYESLTGASPWKASNLASLNSQISKKNISFPSQIQISKRMKRLITDMLSVFPEKRPKYLDVKEEIEKNSSMRISHEQQKIMSCVFFLEVVQWSRKMMYRNKKFSHFIRLIEQNLLKLKQKSRSETQFLKVLEKQIKVVQSLKNKEKDRSNMNYLYKNHLKTSELEQNPQDQWQNLVKNLVTYIIEDLEKVYQQKNEPENQQKLVQINLLLDMIVFKQMPREYLQKPFASYIEQLIEYNRKSLLKLINCKLQLINTKYYK